MIFCDLRFMLDQYGDDNLFSSGIRKSQMSSGRSDKRLKQPILILHIR